MVAAHHNTALSAMDQGMSPQHGVRLGVFPGAEQITLLGVSGERGRRFIDHRVGIQWIHSYPS
jgi:hypothetical protein